ncbi:type II secretion system protein [Methylotenera sp. L2L1]|uniref:type II secretion system protein n=1 Tax=Methylotenera sp. L2L1 TaxID=1502770 RepID=UPI00069171C0|nr:prepilin-type N-terminal cleavage/methylation domain-containing protein [Methylotenera sp. L2L1]
MFMLKSKQQGFTLLELLVVITLLAVLAVGALVAYEDVGDNAEAAAAANANVTLDSAIRTYRAVEKVYPNQWDVLAVTATSGISTLPTAALDIFGGVTLSASNSAAVANSLIAAGIDELQQITGTNPNPVAPNRQHNESVNIGFAQELDLEDMIAAGDQLTVSIVPSAGNNGTGCAFAGDNLNVAFSGALSASSANTIQNKFNDSLEADECHLVLALGFGSDAAASTSSSKVAISQAPTYTKVNSVNPAVNYARYIGLFQVAADDTGNVTGPALEKARLLAVITPDGKVIDDAIADAQ